MAFRAHHMLRAAVQRAHRYGYARAGRGRATALVSLAGGTALGVAASCSERPAACEADNIPRLCVAALMGAGVMRLLSADANEAKSEGYCVARSDEARKRSVVATWVEGSFRGVKNGCQCHQGWLIIYSIGPWCHSICCTA